MKRDHKRENNHSAHPSLYGFHAVREAWLNPERTVQALYITDQAAGGFEQTLREAKNLGVRRPQPVQIDKKRLDKMLPQGAVHQGLGLVTSALEDIMLQELIISSDIRPRTALLMLDQVTDPHNVGAIIRSASALGAHGIIMQKKHAPSLDGVLAKTACGGIEHMPVAFETNLSRTIEELKENGFFVYGLDERGVRNVGDIKFKNKPMPKGQNPLDPPAGNHPHEKILLVLGAEGPGLRRLVKENCDELVKLPTEGPISSLNVSNAAAVALYALLQK